MEEEKKKDVDLGKGLKDLAQSVEKLKTKRPASKKRLINKPNKKNR